MANKEQKDTYDKLLTGGNGDLFSESGFDEMQKAKNYEIGFKLFRVFFWIMYIASFVVMWAAVAYENTAITIIGLVLIAMCTLFYILYAAKASAAGVLNQKFAETMSKKSTLICGIIILAMWLFRILNGTAAPEFAATWIILAVFYISNYLCSRRNMKVLEKMLKEENE